MTSNLSTITATGSNVPLTKSQKKRLKRNAAKNRKAQATAAAVPADDSINPNDLLRNNLVNMGYEMEEINVALDEMWNLSLKYDEVDSVLNYLQERKARSEAAAAARQHETAVERSVVNEDVKEEPDTDASTAASVTPIKTTTVTPKTAPVAPAPPADKPTVGKKATKNASASASASASESTPAMTGTTGSKGKRKGRRPMESAPSNVPANDLGSKLDTVANAENLLDAISALTQWVTKAATVQELKEFCSNSVTHAPTTVILRTISPSANINIVPQLLDLLCSVLRRIGVQTRELTSTAKTLQSTIVRARTATAADTPLDRSVAAAVAKDIVDNVGRTVERVVMAGGKGRKSVRGLEVEIEGIEAEAVNASSGNGAMNARELMSSRDCYKAVTEKYSRILEITMHGSGDGESNNAVSSDGFDFRNGHSESDDIAAALLGDQYRTISDSKREQETLQKRLSQATSSTSNTRRRILSNITAYAAERDTINARIEELKLEMHRLTLSRSDLDRKIEGRKEELARFNKSLTGEEREIEVRLAETNKKVKVLDDVMGVASHLEGLRASLRATSDSFTRASVQKPPVGDTKLQKNMEDYLMRMKRYFESEVRMVGFLQERAMNLEHQVPSLEIEIQECTALGMTSNVSEMTKNLRDMVQNVSDDRGIADALRGEAAKMRDDLMERSEQYMDMVRKGESKALNADQHRHVLDMIRQNASQIELPETRRYRVLIDSIVEMSSPTPPPTTSTAPVSITPTAPAPVPVPAAPVAPAPIVAPIPTPTAPTPTPAPLVNTSPNNDHGYDAAAADNRTEPLGNTTNTSYNNNEIEIPGHVIVNGGIGGIVGAGSTVGQNVAAIEKIVAAAPAPVPLPGSCPPSPGRTAKPGWGRVDDSKTTSRSLLDIQKEELSMK